MSIFRLFELLFFYSLERRFFVREYHKIHFSGLQCLKRKGGKMTNFRPKPWSNPFGKMSIFRVFELLVFVALKSVFSFQNIIKHIFLTCIAYRNKVEKLPILDQNFGLTPLEKCQFFDFFNFLFLQPRKAFFLSKIS